MEKILEDYNTLFDQQYHQMMKNKLGLEENYDNILHDDLQAVLKLTETDMTIFYRNLSSVLKTDFAENALEKISNAFYKPGEIKKK